MLIMSNMGDHVWLITSRHTEPDLLVYQDMSTYFGKVHTTRQYLGEICDLRSRCLVICRGTDPAARREPSIARPEMVLHFVRPVYYIEFPIDLLSSGPLNRT